MARGQLCVHSIRDCRSHRESGCAVCICVSIVVCFPVFVLRNRIHGHAHLLSGPILHALLERTIFCLMQTHVRDNKIRAHDNFSKDGYRPAYYVG